MSKIYLSGPISGLTFGECTDWREYVASKLPGSISPLRGKEFLKSVGVINQSYEHHPFATAKGITTRDRNDVYTCDLMLVNLLGASKITIGTMIEVGWADAFRKPIVLVMEPDNLHSHPILNTCCGYICTTLDEGIECAKIIVLHKE